MKTAQPAIQLLNFMAALENDTYQTNVLYEKEVQDYLAAHLTLLGDPNLTLVQTEHPVKFGGDSGRIDILAVDDDGTYVVIEIKRGIAGRGAIGQLQSYMGVISEANPDRRVRGILVSLSIDEAARAALKMTHSIDHFEFQTHFEFKRLHLGPHKDDLMAMREAAVQKNKDELAAKQEGAVRGNYWGKLGGAVLDQSMNCNKCNVWSKVVLVGLNLPLFDVPLSRSIVRP